MLLMLLRLRQACNHPGLVKDSTGGTVALHPPTAAQVAAARELPEALRKELMAAGLECASQCPICDDIPEDAVVSVCKHVYCRTCIVTKMQEPEWEDRPLCPCCSAVLKDEASLHSPAALMEAESGGQGAMPGAPPLQISGVPPLPEDGHAISSAKVEQLMEILKKIRSGSRNGRDNIRKWAPCALSLRLPVFVRRSLALSVSLSVSLSLSLSLSPPPCSRAVEGL